MNTYGRTARVKRLATSPLIQAYDQLNALAQTPENQKKKSEVLAMILAALKTDPDGELSGYEVLPAVGSPMEYILADFKTHSSIPLGIPWWTVFSHTAQHLCEQGAAVELPGGDRVIPTMYILVLADSGECKTWVAKHMGRAFPHKLNKIPKPKTAESLLQRLKENDGKPAQMDCDELGRAWRRWMLDPDKSLIQDVLLQAYTQEHIEESLKAKDGGYDIKRPILSVMGYSQWSLFSTHFLAEDWHSGLIQRFILSICPPRQGWQKQLELYPLQCKLEEPGGSLDKLKELIATTPIHPSYKMDDAARAYAKHHIQEAVVKWGVTKGFALRALFNSYKYALLFHYLHSKTSDMLDRQDMEYAVVLCLMNLQDLSRLIDQTEHNELSDLVEKAMAAKAKLDDGKLKGDWSRRWLAQHVRGIEARNCNLVFEIVNSEIAMAEFRDDSPDGTGTGVTGGPSKPPQTPPNILDFELPDDMKPKMANASHAGAGYKPDPLAVAQAIIDAIAAEDKARNPSAAIQ